jgi:hypothetical protein
MHNFDQKKYFSQKYFFNYFSRLISKIFSGIFFFPDSNFRVLTFFRLFFEKILFWIFFLILSLETLDSARICYFWCFFEKKWLNLKETVILALFLKNQIFVDFRIFENFLVSRYHRIFYSPFSYQSGLKLLIYAKKIIKNYFRRIAWTLSYIID